MTTTETRLVERAAEIGREHRAAYEAEFGAAPVRGAVGDWDSTGWGEATVAIERLVHPSCSLADQEYAECHRAYLSALFAD